MRKPQATLLISGVILAISATSNAPSVFGQGFLKRLQDRVQSLDQQNAGTQLPPATEPAETGPRAGAGGQRTNQRRPLVDALLQYGPEIFAGQGNSNPASVGTDAERGRAAGRAAGAATQTRPTGEFQKASLGIDVLDSAPGVPGVLVTGFRSDSKADDAGLQKNDVIVSLDQTLTPKIADIAKFLSVRRAGESVTARVLRGDQMKTIRIPLLGSQQANIPAAQQSGGPMPDSSLSRPPLPRSPVPNAPVPNAPVPRSPVQARSVTETLPIAGQVESLPAPVARPSTQLSTNTGVQRYGILLGSKSRLRGALIDGVVSGSAADVAGIKPADRVVSVDGLLTHDDRALVRQLANLPQQTVASLGVVRGDTYLIKSMMLTTEIKSGGSGQQLNASTKRQSTDEENMETETGVLEGIGSVLGDLFGGAGKKDGKAQVEMVPPKREEDLKSSEPVRQTSFEQKVSGQLTKMAGDPPSLNGLPVKPKSETADNATDLGKSEQSAAEMREEIRQLQEKLKQMEGRSQRDGEAVPKKTPPASKSE